VAVASLTAGLRGSAALGGLLLLPLAVPLLIFGASAAGSGEPGALKLEAAVALFILIGAPLVTAAALRTLRT
jgi:heme exporter protein B